ncbi:MAG: hypothetical protein Q8Q89_04955 [bacterium]|nr:hypothetical protein [bacterium]
MSSPFTVMGISMLTPEKIQELQILIDQRVEEYFRKLFFPDFKTYIFPGGKMPKRATDGAIGYDFFLRALVSPFDMESNKILRKNIFDFNKLPKDPFLESRVTSYPGDNGIELAYKLGPGESILGGVGCVVEMNFPTFHWIAPRSGLASKWQITVTNAPGTVDPDYRGEAGVLIRNINNTESILLTRHMKIAQGIFSLAVIPNLILVETYEELSKTVRSAQGFGSTGIR